MANHEFEISEVHFPPYKNDFFKTFFPVTGDGVDDSSDSDLELQPFHSLDSLSAGSSVDLGKKSYSSIENDRDPEVLLLPAFDFSFTSGIQRNCLEESCDADPRSSSADVEADDRADVATLQEMFPHLPDSTITATAQSSPTMDDAIDRILLLTNGNQKKGTCRSWFLLQSIIVHMGPCNGCLTLYKVTKLLFVTSIPSQVPRNVKDHIQTLKCK